jgi:hypothetical protein
MPKVRRVLGACTVEIAQRRRICHRDRKNHSIPKGAACLVIKDAASAGSKSYCPQCALAILDQAADDLQALRARLS